MRIAFNHHARQKAGRNIVDTLLGLSRGRPRLLRKRTERRTAGKQDQNKSPQEDWHGFSPGNVSHANQLSAKISYARFLQKLKRSHTRLYVESPAVPLNQKSATLTGSAVQSGEDFAPRRRICLQLINPQQLIPDMNAIDRRLAILRGDRRHNILMFLRHQGEAHLIEIVRIQFRLTQPIHPAIWIVDREAKTSEDIAPKPSNHRDRIFLRIPVHEIFFRRVRSNRKRAKLLQPQRFQLGVWYSYHGAICLEAIVSH
jgi:hypothetical protein